MVIYSAGLIAMPLCHISKWRCSTVTSLPDWPKMAMASPAFT